MPLRLLARRSSGEPRRLAGRWPPADGHVGGLAIWDLVIIGVRNQVAPPRERPRVSLEIATEIEAGNTSARLLVAMRPPPHGWDVHVSIFPQKPARS